MTLIIITTQVNPKEPKGPQRKPTAVIIIMLIIRTPGNPRDPKGTQQIVIIVLIILLVRT